MRRWWRLSLKSTVAVWVTPCAMKLHVRPEKPEHASPHVVVLLPRTGGAVKLALVPVSIVPTQSAPQRMPGPVTLPWLPAVPLLVTTIVGAPDTRRRPGPVTLPWLAALPVLVTTIVVTPENSALVL